MQNASTRFTKSAETIPQPPSVPENDQLAQLNQFTRRTLSPEEVFLFDVRLCDNEIDRDGERFTLPALAQLQTLFVGKTGIFDHDPRGENQTARLYATEVVTDPSRQTAAGEPYTYLKGHAYMVRTDANRDLIREIDGGIKKEVSIACTAASQTCSICGSDRRKKPCVHQIGQWYGEQLCHILLDDITDAYEWSFVAVPAQREAGVTKQKRFLTDAADRRLKMLEQQLQAKEALLEQVTEAVRKDITRLRYLVEGTIQPDAVSAAADRMTLEELLAFQETLRTQQKKACLSQLAPDMRTDGNRDFRL